MYKGKLIKKNCGDVFYFYIDNNGLCYRSATNVRKPKIILKNAVFDFDVTCTDVGFCVICQDDEGSIIYLKEKNGVFLKYTLFYNKSKNGYVKHFKIIENNNTLIAFYILDSNNDKMLVYHNLNNTNSVPEVIDCVTTCNYYVFNDSAGFLNIIYNNENIIYTKITDCAATRNVYKSECAEFIRGIYYNKKLFSVIVRQGNYYISEGENYEKLDCLVNSNFVIPCVMCDNLYIIYIKSGQLFELNLKNLKGNKPSRKIVSRKDCDVFSVEIPDENIITNYAFGYFCEIGISFVIFNALLKNKITEYASEEKLPLKNELLWKEEIVTMEQNIKKLEESEQNLKNKITKIEEFLLKLYEMNNEI